MPDRTPEFIQDWLSKNSYKLDGPAQFLGNEPNSDQAGEFWDKARVRWLIAASWGYSESAGNIAIPAVYRAVNYGKPDFLCDRSYLPATPRDLRLLEQGGIPVFGIESKHQMRDFDVVGTSISYTVLFQNFSKQLMMSSVPLRRADRWAEDPGKYPMVLVGGQASSHPAFMDPVVDCVFCGDAEDEPGNGGISQVCARIAMFRQDGIWRSDRISCYTELAREFSYLYFPHTLAVEYRYEDRGLEHPSKQVSGYRSTLPGMAMPRRMRKVRDLDKTRPLTSIPLLFGDPGLGSGDIEVGKGCQSWCSFCAVSLTNKPYRQESVDRSVAKAKQWRLNMGPTELTPFSLDPPMHTQKRELYARLQEEVCDEVSTSSFRVDDALGDRDFFLLMAAGGLRSVTVGLEGNSQRTRDLSGKGTSDDAVCEMVTRAIAAGIRKIKVYMITNWPGEDAADVMKIVELGRRLAAIREGFGGAARGVQILFSWTPLLIEAQTPLQWFAPTLPDYTLQSAMDLLKDVRIAVQIGTSAQPNKLAFFQACQRASRDAGEAIVDVIEALDTASWGGFAKDMRERLDAALIKRGFLNGLEDLYGERFKDDLLGWEFIDTGVSRELLWRAYAGMVEFLENTDGATYDEGTDPKAGGAEWVPRCDQQCSGNSCGACDKQDLELRSAYIKAGKNDRDLEQRPVQRLDHTTVACRIRMKVLVPEESRFVSNEHWKHLIRRAAYRAVEQTGFPPIAKRSVRLASDMLNYRNRSCGADYAEFGVTRQVTRDGAQEFLSGASGELEPWMTWGGSFQVLPADAKLPARPVSLWELEVSDGPAQVRAALRRWAEASSVPVLIKSDSFYAGTQQEKEDAKTHVADMWLVRDQHRYVLRFLLTGRLGPYQGYSALMGRSSWIEAAAKTARRLDFFTATGNAQGDLLRPSCAGCGYVIPVSLLGASFDYDYCPRCLDEESGAAVAGLERLSV